MVKTKAGKNNSKKSYISKRIESIDTKELENVLLSNKYKKAKDIVNENKEYLVDDDKRFSYFVKDLIKEKGMTIKKVVLLTGLSEGFGRKVISGEKITDKRDLIIGICISAGFSLEETNRALKLYGMQALYAKYKRDAVIIIEINKGDTSIESINRVLEENDLEPLKINSK